MGEAHDCNWRDGIGCINDRCVLHRAMRALSANLVIAAGLCRAFLLGCWYGNESVYLMGDEEPTEWRPGCNLPTPRESPVSE